MFFGETLNPVAAIPFSFSDFTYWWDFNFPKGNKLLSVNGAGSATLAVVPDRLGRKNDLIQTGKGQQPLVSAGVGAGFNTGSLRSLTPRKKNLTNGKLGWYLATNMKIPVVGNPAVQSSIASFSRAASALASRGDLLITNSRAPTLKFADAEGSSVVAIAAAPVIAFNTSYTFECLVDTVADTVSMWLNGVAQTLSGTVPLLSAFPATDPNTITFGNACTSGATTSFDGFMQQIIFEDGIPSTTNRASISSFLNANRLA